MKKRILAVVLTLFFASAANAQSITWPQEIDAGDGAVVVMYQPQVEEFSGNSLGGRAAVAVRSGASDDAPVFGAIWFEAKIDIDRDARTAVIRNLDVTDTRFSDASDDQLKKLASLIESQVGRSQFTISVDQLLADLDTAGQTPDDGKLKHDPPKIILATEPAMLVSIDGDPVWKGIEGNFYERVVNSPFLIARGGKNYYLYVGSNAWYGATSMDGSWFRLPTVPEDVAALVEPADDDDLQVDSLKIIIATEATELINSDGEPSWTPVGQLDLLYMDNTDSNVFLELTTQRYYVLLSGRWYRGEGVVGNLQWVHIPNDELPESFGDIPDDSPTAEVLSQVAGTPQARDAVLDNTIPQTAAIKRDDDSFKVEYDGEPEFAPIEDIQVEYAQNTSSAVFRYGNLYYACDSGIWYVANSANGPWKVATEVPDAIYDIPSSNAHHNVTYVKVYDVTPEVVYVGYTPGYYGSYYYRGSVIYGSGWYYNPWYGPYYYPRYPTWGFHVTYNPWYGWGFGVSWTNDPFRFTFAGGGHGGWWGMGGYRPYPRPVPYGGYRKTNHGVATRPAAQPNLYNRPQTRDRVATRPSTADNRARPATGMQNNVLTDHSGNIYQRDNNGSWQQRDKGQWRPPQNLDRAPSTQPSQRPSWPSQQPAVRPQIERDYNARQQGAARTQNFNRGARPRRR